MQVTRVNKCVSESEVESDVNARGMPDMCMIVPMMYNIPRE